jgi:drug/metabolite transporter (DMT)-like permease
LREAIEKLANAPRSCISRIFGRILPEPSTTMKQLRTLPLLLTSTLACLPAWAHEGHGMPGFAHWHASDVLGFVAVLGAIAAVIWFKGGK